MSRQTMKTISIISYSIHTILLLISICLSINTIVDIQLYRSKLFIVLAIIFSLILLIGVFTPLIDKDINKKVENRLTILLFTLFMILIVILFLIFATTIKYNSIIGIAFLLSLIFLGITIIMIINMENK